MNPRLDQRPFPGARRRCRAARGPGRGGGTGRPAWITWRCLAALALLATRLGAGQITYPAIGNLDLEEGTIEIWLTPMRALYTPSVAYQGLLHCGAVRNDHFSMSLAWYAKNNTHMIEANLGGGRLANVTAQAPADWTPGQMHYVAFTWQGATMVLFADEAGGDGGRQVTEQNRRIQLEAFDQLGSPGDTLVIAGQRDGYQTYVIVHAVRISAVARELAAAPVPPLDRTALDDVYTLLLDIYEANYVDGATTPVTLSGLAGENGGRGNAAFVEAGSTQQGLLAEPVTIFTSGFRMY
ncbi:MAG: LamG domain-containing protein [Candidatus Marinimicrobia bacterium]|nr:LamG domain-containing protein [Candidatus Neomarinimicrobiota bacterium]